MGKVDTAKKLIWFSRPALAVIVFSLSLSFALNVSWAQTDAPKSGIGNWGSELDKGVSKTGIYNTEATGGGTAVAIAKYVGWILFFAPFFSLLFMARVVLAGYEWMTAAGNSEKIELAKKRIKNAVIGIIILAILYFLSYFFINTFAGFTGYKI
ncbi:MAG: hypothetical protein PHR36_00805 [Patescibacteria group bacterium]|nr:hypothetical protein [Patescibacteria group bacterium]